MLVNAYFQGRMRIPFLDFDIMWVVAALIWSGTKVSNFRMLFSFVTMENVEYK
jgi:hypothetical protein